jgi:hypothetical protein
LIENLKILEESSSITHKEIKAEIKEIIAMVGQRF